MKNASKARFDALKVAASALALTVGAGLGGQATAQSAGDYDATIGSSLDIVTNHTVTPGPGNPANGSNFANSPQVLDPAGFNGVGQQITLRPDGFLGLCTGTLINPRTVITAKHCVDSFADHEYGSDTGTTPLPPNLAALFGPTNGIPISFGFAATNRCQGVAVNGCAVNTGPYERWRDTNFSTQTGLGIYNGNQVWSMPGGNEEFANGDIALVTLDTHVDNIPTWTLLFSPLDSETHAIITGYGGRGVGTIGNIGIDYRRRSAENMIDALMTNNDWVDSPAIDPGNTSFADNQHAIYWMDFDDPDFQWSTTNVPANFFAPGGYFDFNGLGGPAPNGTALPLEGATAGGDSGGPLIVDQRFDIPVVAGVLTGSWSFNGGVSKYGQFNVYPPLFPFWEQIVENNPYVYAENRHGVRDWTNPAHWVQTMDPNYAVIGSDGELVNTLPDSPQGGADVAVDKFGTLCFLEVSCTTFDGPGAPAGDGTPNWTPATSFVPNNIEPINSADPSLRVRATYYDVTLAAIGETRVTTAITIDRLTVDGFLTSLDVRSGGNLSIWGDFNIDSGFVNIDGHVNAGEALLLQGFLTGSGTFNPRYLTSVDGVIAPGNLHSVGTLTVQGDVVLASETELMIELGRNANDLLRVTADAAQGTPGDISLGGDLWLTPAGHGGGGAPRHGNVYTIVLADGSVADQFDSVNGFLGVLRPHVTYTANSVEVKLKAGSFLDLLFHAPGLMPLALALDELREHHYNSLYDLYGEIDLMDPARLSRAFSSMTPQSLMDTHGLLSMQQATFGNTLQDRLSFLARGGAQPGEMSFMGAPGDILSFGGEHGLAAAPELAFASMLTESRHVTALPGGMTAFVSGGYGESGASTAAGRAALTRDESLRTWNVAGGVEHTMDNLTLGVAASYSEGSAMQSSTMALSENDLGQAAIYGVYRLDHGMYVSGLVGAGASRANLERRFMAGSIDNHMGGTVEGELFMASLEAGMNIDVSDTFTFTPNVSLRQYSVTINGFEENGGETALAIAEQTYESAEARIGARLAGSIGFSGWTLSPSIEASAVANLIGEEEGVWAAFAVAPDVSFYLPGMARDDFWGEVVGGLRLDNGNTSFAINVETNVGRDDLYEDRYMARYAYRF